jgi:hypothetical protein
MKRNFPYPEGPHVPKDQCAAHGVYTLRSRNLSCGAWTGECFIGEREKFGRLFLASEDHWDQGPPHGTAKPFKLIGMIPPDVDVNPLLSDNEGEARLHKLLVQIENKHLMMLNHRLPKRLRHD